MVFFFQAEDGIRDLVRSRGLGDVYKRQVKKLRLSFRVFQKLGANRRKQREKKATRMRLRQTILERRLVRARQSN